MRRLLSQTLIIILLLLGPITFTTASIPNFQPDCETGNYTRARATVRVAIADRPPRTTSPLPAAITPETVAPAALHPANANLFFPACYSRPPPHTTHDA